MAEQIGGTFGIDGAGALDGDVLSIELQMAPRRSRLATNSRECNNDTSSSASQSPVSPGTVTERN